jgi:23S rRNA (uracil1939-C5)-methyltransferase
LNQNINNQISIQSLVYEGYGFARLPDGKAAFIPFVLPGEKVQIRVAEEKQRFVIADLISVEEQNSKRIHPRCVHFGTCGGCHYQHISYADQIQFKQEILYEQFQRIGKMDPLRFDASIPSPDEWAYRNVMQFHLDTDGNLCFKDRKNNLFPVSECHLPMPDISRIWPQIEFGAGLRIDRLVLRQNQDGDILIGVFGPIEQVPEISTDIPISIVHHGEHEVLVMAGDDHLNIQVGEKEFLVHAASFFQTNLRVAEKMAQKVREIVQSHECRSILDVFCGVGLFSAYLADIAGEIIGIESLPSACDDYAINLDAYDNISLYQDRAERVLPELKKRIDCAILDPPRGGLKKEVVQALHELKPELIIYVSCNPSTLARDSRHLIKGGYQLTETILVDMFPQTYHIESINTFIRV